MVDPRTNILIRNNLTNFTYYNVEDGEVRYKHDDSETLEDQFEFKVRVVKKELGGGGGSGYGEVRYKRDDSETLEEQLYFKVRVVRGRGSEVCYKHDSETSRWQL